MPLVHRTRPTRRRIRHAPPHHCHRRRRGHLDRRARRRTRHRRGRRRRRRHRDATTAKRGLRCVAAGVRTLAELGILDDAARRQVDYSDFADPQNGPIFTTLPDDSYLSLGTVIKLHLTNPELFAWCR